MDDFFEDDILFLGIVIADMGFPSDYITSINMRGDTYTGIIYVNIYLRNSDLRMVILTYPNTCYLVKVVVSIVISTKNPSKSNEMISSMEMYPMHIDHCSFWVHDPTPSDLSDERRNAVAYFSKYLR